MTEGSHAILAFGKNWELPIPADPGQIKPSFDTSLTAEAAAILFTTGRQYDRIILSSGHTRGPRYPSEAAAMLGVLREHYDPSRIPDEAIMLEEESFDTASNLKEVNELCRREGITSITLLSVGYHLPRIKHLAKRLLDVPVVGTYASESVVVDAHNKPVFFYTRSIVRQVWERRSFRPLMQVAASYSFEAAAWVLTLIDPSGEGISAKITSRMRHQ